MDYINLSGEKQLNLLSIMKSLLNKTFTQSEQENRRDYWRQTNRWDRKTWNIVYNKAEGDRRVKILKYLKYLNKELKCLKDKGECRRMGEATGWEMSRCFDKMAKSFTWKTKLQKRHMREEQGRIQCDEKAK